LAVLTDAQVHARLDDDVARVLEADAADVLFIVEAIHLRPEEEDTCHMRRRIHVI
jgi:hypothetical protein